jgi:signal transduction histidine kinase
MSDTELLVDIRDNGIGFDPENAQGSGNGLRNMRHRTEELRGRLQLRSAPGQGTHIQVRIPLKSLGRKSVI